MRLFEVAWCSWRLLNCQGWGRLVSAGAEAASRQLLTRLLVLLQLLSTLLLARWAGGLCTGSHRLSARPLLGMEGKLPWNLLKAQPKRLFCDAAAVASLGMLDCSSRAATELPGWLVLLLKGWVRREEDWLNPACSRCTCSSCCESADLAGRVCITE